VPEDSEWLTATALDVSQRFVLRLSRTCLRAGTTIVQLQNQDAQEHDLWAEGTSPVVAKREVVESAAPESMAQAETQLTAGEWRLFCSIPGHGTMSRTVSVVG
jgi:azurin